MIRTRLNFLDCVQPVSEFARAYPKRFKNS